MLRGQCTFGDAPGPVVVLGAGTIHARFAAEVEDVLNGDDGRLGDGCVRGADQAPGNVAGIAHAEVRRDRVALGGEGVLVPAACGVVVVRAGVDDGFRIVAMRKVRTVRLREGEL